MFFGLGAEEAVANFVRVVFPGGVFFVTVFFLATFFLEALVEAVRGVVFFFAMVIICRWQEMWSKKRPNSQVALSGMFNKSLK